METQIAVANVAARQVGCLSQPLYGAIFVTSPCINHSEISYQRCAFNGVSANGRQFDCAFAFADRILLIPKYGIDNAKRAKCSRIIRLLLYCLAKFVSRVAECLSSCRLIAAGFGKLTLAPAARKWDIFVKA